MTQGRKRKVILIAILVLLLAVIWGYLTFTGRQSEDLGYLVRRNRYEMENTVEYEPECRTKYGAKFERKRGGEPDFLKLEMSEMKYKEERKDCYG